MIEYKKADRLLIIYMFVPNKDCLPKIKEVRYVKTQKKIKEIELNKTESNMLFEHAAYSICLRAISEVFYNDANNDIDIVSFTGYVRARDLATGRIVKPPIFSVDVNVSEFRGLILEEVDPKQCFLKLKGISYSKLENLVPIKPLQIPMRVDSRFVESRSISPEMQEGQNLATMDWKEFEDFVVELFRAIYAKVGGDVRRTQSSGDGGVDAFAHDPSPVTGGEIIVQAKRYSSTIGPKQVRELHGTLLHEGAIKGILVTTSRFGPAAYKAAKGKPIELIGGAELLGLAETYLGRNFRIELSEAREKNES